MTGSFSEPLSYLNGTPSILIKEGSQQITIFAQAFTRGE